MCDAMLTALLLQCAQFRKKRLNGGCDMALFRFFNMEAVRNLRFLGHILGPPTEHSVVFIIGQNLVGIHLVVCIIWKFKYFAHLAGKYVFIRDAVLGTFTLTRTWVEFQSTCTCTRTCCHAGTDSTEPTDSDDDCMTFWAQTALHWTNWLHQSPRAPSVPASSAALECVFSQGGIILRLHRACMREKMLSALIFLKCNGPRGIHDRLD